MDSFKKSFMDQFDSLSNDNKKMEEEKNEAIKQKRIIEQDKNVLYEENKAMKENIEKLKEDIKNLEKEKEEKEKLENDIRMMEKQIDELSQKNEKMVEEIKLSKIQYTELMKEKDAVNRKNGELEATVKILNTKLEDEEKKRQFAEKERYESIFKLLKKNVEDSENILKDSRASMENGILEVRKQVKAVQNETVIQMNTINDKTMEKTKEISLSYDRKVKNLEVKHKNEIELQKQTIKEHEKHSIQLTQTNERLEKEVTRVGQLEYDLDVYKSKYIEKKTLLKETHRKERPEPNLPQEIIVDEIGKNIEKINESFQMLKNKSRLDRKIIEVGKEEFWYYEPTKFSSRSGSLEFHHDIGGVNTKFITRFMKKEEDSSEFQSYESLEGRKRSRFFENVVVNLEKDENLRKIVRGVKTDFSRRLIESQKKKDEDLSLVEIKRYMKEINRRILGFFYPNNNVKRTEEEIRKVIKDAISKSQDTRVGNNLWLGDLEGSYGFCRHRATLFKVICDALNIRCKMEIVYNFHAWNVVQLRNSFFIVDLMISDEVIEIQDYHAQLEVYWKNEKNKKIKDSIHKILIDKRVEEERIELLQRFLRGEDKQDFEYIVGNNSIGGFGDVILLKIKNDIPLNLDEFKGFKFTRGEVIAVKRILVKENDNDVKKDRVSRRIALREATNMKILNHTNILRTLGFWEGHDTHNMPRVNIAMKAMDIDGKFVILTFSKALDEKRITKDRAFVESIFFLLEVARGLRYLSTLKIVHLDIKPENVMVNWDKKENMKIKDVKIIDFGGAKNSNVLTSTLISTKKYDSKEILDFKGAKEIKDLIEVAKKEYNDNQSVEKNTISTIKNKFEYLSRFNIYKLKEYFDFVVFLREKIEDKKFRDVITKNWIKEMERKFDLDTDESPEYDCRADIFSYGILMNEFKNGNLLPFELEELMNQCRRENRSERPSIDIIIHKLKTHLSFFNEKEKENMVKEKIRLSSFNQRQ